MISKKECLTILQSDGDWWDHYAKAIIVKKNKVSQPYPSKYTLKCKKWSLR